MLNVHRIVNLDNVKMKVMTLAELAKKIGVGTATVDRVLNDRGGVSPALTNMILKAAREAGIKRVLPQEHRPTWQIEVLLSSNKSFFFEKLANDFSTLADELGYRRLRLHRTLLPEDAPEMVANHIEFSCRKMDALIIFAHENTAIYNAIKVCKSLSIPVITLVADLPGAERLCHVGIDQFKAGRTAGFVLGSMQASPADVLIISGRTQYAVHRQRIEGFQSVIRDYFPHINLREIIYGQDNRELISRLFEKALGSKPRIKGIYNTGTGNTQVNEALSRHRLQGDITYITHELYDTTRQLLADRILTLTIDQNALRHAQLALGLILDYLEKSSHPEEYDSGKVDFMLHTPENYI